MTIKSAIGIVVCLFYLKEYMHFARFLNYVTSHRRQECALAVASYNHMFLGIPDLFIYSYLYLAMCQNERACKVPD